jgi:DNA-binding response OmpR family regulator
VEGYEATEATDGETAVSLCRQSPFDLMVLDVAVSGMDGFSVLQTVRTFSPIPILVLSAKCGAEERIRGLELGCDDYVAKPCPDRELMLRIAAILKRGPVSQPAETQDLVNGGIHIDLTARRVFVDDVRINMTPKEFDLLTLLVSHPDVAFSRKQLLDMVWGGELSGDTRTLDTHIKQIRHAIAPYNDRIVTLRGVGYRFE